jgi:serine/threonine-protein kinase
MGRGPSHFVRKSGRVPGKLVLIFLLVNAAAAQEPLGCSLEVVAGGGRTFSGDGGPAPLAEFDHPGDAVAGPDGSIYVADTGNGRVRLISPDGLISTMLKSLDPARLAVSPEGDLFVFDRKQRRVIRRMSNGFVRTVLADQGLGAEMGLDAGPGPTLYLADTENHRLLRLDRTGRLTTVSAEVGEPSDVALGPDGSLYLPDVRSRKIKRVWPNGSVSDFAAVPGGSERWDLQFADFLLGIIRPFPRSGTAGGPMHDWRSTPKARWS